MSIVVTVACLVVLFHLSHLPPSFPPSSPLSLPPSSPLSLPPSLPPPSLLFSTEDIQHWDPMSDDFKSSSFNSYTEGPGALLPSSLGKDENICLYVFNIPTTITKVWGGGVWSHSWNAVYMHCSIVLRFMWLTPRGSYPEEEVCKCSISRDIPSVWKFLCCKIFVLLDYSCGLGHPRRFFDSIKSVLLSQLV